MDKLGSGEFVLCVVLSVNRDREGIRPVHVALPWPCFYPVASFLSASVHWKFAHLDSVAFYH